MEINKKYKTWYISSTDDTITLTLHAVDEVSKNHIRISCPLNTIQVAVYQDKVSYIDNCLTKMYELIDTYDKGRSKTSFRSTESIQ